MNEHRDKAVEAAARAMAAPSKYDSDTRNDADLAVRAAEPHLQRMYFERFKEAMLSEEGIDLAESALLACDGTKSVRSDAFSTVLAALSKAQQLMEEGG